MKKIHRLIIKNDCCCINPHKCDTLVSDGCSHSVTRGSEKHEESDLLVHCSPSPASPHPTPGNLVTDGQVNIYTCRWFQVCSSSGVSGTHCRVWIRRDQQFDLTGQCLMPEAVFTLFVHRSESLRFLLVTSSVCFNL